MHINSLFYVLRTLSCWTWYFCSFYVQTYPQCSQSINSLIDIYSVHIPSCFLWVPDHSQWHAQCFCTHIPGHVMWNQLSIKALSQKAAPIFFIWKLSLRQKRRLKVVGTFRKYGWCMHILNHKNVTISQTWPFSVVYYCWPPIFRNPCSSWNNWFGC